MHDLEVLIARTRAHTELAWRVHTARSPADLDRLVRRLENECRQLHGHYMASREAICSSLCDRLIARPRAARPPRTSAA